MESKERSQSQDNQQPPERGMSSSSDAESLESFTAAGFKMLVEATKRSNNLPFSKSRDFYESFPVFHTLIGKQSDYVLSMLSLIMKHTNCKGNIKKRDDDDKFEMIVDANDSILENVGISLDELSGIKRNPNPEFIAKTLNIINGSWNKNDRMTGKGTTQVLNKILNQTKSLEKPQIHFKDKINNDPDVPFEPRIKYKYNLLKPLALVAEINEDGICHFTHPYGFELEKFKPPKEQLTYQPPKLYKSLEETPFHFITTPEAVASMVEDLEKYKEIAIDLEHHSYRSFQGFTCLMQISTRDTDYVIDTLLLRSDLEILNKVFTDPSIVKVFHGADLDILWLQRDLALYIVNMFDTHQAAKLLQFSKLSLAYLLSHYCNVTAQKHFQLADWRIRPLPQELLTYAREDTHYLLFIYDKLRNALIEKANGHTNLLESVISESTRICLKNYIKPLYESDGYLDMYHRSKKLFDNRQKFALQKLYEWRDKTARELDESCAYVLPNHMMLNISEVLPREAQGILACCNPIPAPVRQNLLILHQMILKAREQPLIKPVLEEQRLFRHVTTVNSSESPLLCPHDLNHEGEFRDDLQILFNKNINNATEKNPLCSTPIINIFEKRVEIPEKVKLVSAAEKAIHLSPYHRYKLAKTFSESIDAKNLAKNEKARLPPPSLVIKTELPDDEMDNKNSEEDVQDPNLINQKNVKRKDKKAPSSAKKRKSDEDKNTPLKKIKKEENFLNPFRVPGSDGKYPKKLKEKKKRKKNNSFAGQKEKEFQPFDYKSVDFEKYQSLPAPGKKKVQRKPKQRKKGGRKDFKIAL